MYGDTVSTFHLRFYAYVPIFLNELINRVRTSTSLSIVCMNDLSSGTGYIHNGQHFSSSAKCRLGGQVVGTRMIVLRDGDTIQIPNTPQGTFSYGSSC